MSFAGLTGETILADAPVHSIAAALFLQPQEIHWFHE
jgi:hypothetical protein